MIRHLLVNSAIGPEFCRPEDRRGSARSAYEIFSRDAAVQQDEGELQDRIEKARDSVVRAIRAQTATAGVDLMLTSQAVPAELQRVGRARNR